MTRTFFLDSTPLGLLSQPQRSAETIAITEWASRCLLAKARLIVPAIVYYELKRELLRANKTSGLSRLEAFVSATPGRYLPLTDQALRLAAGLWADARKTGHLTADWKALDIDVLIAAQSLCHEPGVTIVTANAKHLSKFVTAIDWSEIDP